MRWLLGLRRGRRSIDERVGPERAERLEWEDRFDREVEEAGDAEGEVEARRVLAALDVADRLVVDAERLGEVVARDAAVGPEQRQAVEDELARRASRAGVVAMSGVAPTLSGRASSSAGASGSIQASAAKGRNGTYSADGDEPRREGASCRAVIGPTKLTGTAPRHRRGSRR